MSDDIDHCFKELDQLLLKKDQGKLVFWFQIESLLKCTLHVFITGDTVDKYFQIILF